VIADILAIFPEIILIFCASILLLCNSMRGYYVARLSTLCCVISVILACYQRYTQVVGYFWSNSIYLDASINIMRVAVLVIGALVLLNLSYVMERNKNMPYEIPVLFLLAISGVSLMLSSNDLIMLYISMELVSLSICICIAFDKGKITASEAAVKYFIFSAVASCMYLFGSSLVYGFVKSIDFQSISNYRIPLFYSEIFANNIEIIPVLFVVGAVMILAAILFKLAIFPFHIWVSDVYQGSNIAVTAFVATVSKLGYIVVLMRLVSSTLLSVSSHVLPVITALALTSVFIGALAAIKQRDIMRLLAYSGVSNVGFALSAILYSKENTSSINNVILYLVIYVVLTLSILLSLSMLRRAANARCASGIDDTSEKDNVVCNDCSCLHHNGVGLSFESLSGISKRHPFFAGSLLISILSLMGVPPFIGFFAKVLVLSSVLAAGYYYVAIYLIIMTIVSSFYYLRIIKIIYFDEFSEETTNSVVKSKIIFCILLIISIINLGWMFFV